MIILTQNKIINEFVDDVRPGDFETEHFNTINENLFDPVDEENENKLKELPLSKENQDEIVEMVEIQLLLLQLILLLLLVLQLLLQQLLLLLLILLLLLLLLLLIQCITIQQISQLVAVQVIPETQKSNEATSPIVKSNRNQQLMQFIQSIVQIAPAQSLAIAEADCSTIIACIL